MRHGLFEPFVQFYGMCNVICAQSELCSLILKTSLSMSGYRFHHVQSLVALFLNFCRVQGMADENVELPRADLVDYVRNMLNEGTSLKRIAESLRISDPKQLKQMMTKALGYEFQVYHHFTTEKMSTTIQGALPITEHGANWGIRHVKAALSYLCFRAPQQSVASTLQVISGPFKIPLSFYYKQHSMLVVQFEPLLGNSLQNSIVLLFQVTFYVGFTILIDLNQFSTEADYNRRRRALPIVRRQYNVTIPIALWHIDCELPSLLIYPQHCCTSFTLSLPPLFKDSFFEDSFFFTWDCARIEVD